jgi:hypothetical protein
MTVKVDGSRVGADMFDFHRIPSLSSSLGKLEVLRDMFSVRPVPRCYKLNEFRVL